MATHDDPVCLDKVGNHIVSFMAIPHILFKSGTAQAARCLLESLPFRETFNISGNFDLFPKLLIPLGLTN